MYIFQISLPQNAMFFSKKAPAMNLSVLEVMAMVQWCRCLLVMSPQYPPSGAWALQQALPSTKATRETGWAMTAMNLEPFVFWEGELGRWHPLWRRVGVPEQKSKLKPKRFMTFLGGSGYFCQGTMVIRSCFFEALFEVLYSSKWIKMAKKRRKHVFPNDPTLAKWKRSNFAQWAATLKDPRWHGSSPEAYIEVTYMFGGVYVAKTLHFYVVLGGSWYKKLAFLSLELTLGKKDQTFSTCSCLEELKVVRMGITTNGNVHTSYSSIIFILFLPVHIFYLGKWSPSEKK